MAAALDDTSCVSNVTLGIVLSNPTKTKQSSWGIPNKGVLPGFALDFDACFYSGCKKISIPIDIAISCFAILCRFSETLFIFNC